MSITLYSVLSKLALISAFILILYIIICVVVCTSAFIRMYQLSREKKINKEVKKSNASQLNAYIDDLMDTNK